MSFPALAPNACLRWDVVSRLLPPEARSVLEVGCGQGSMGARIAARSDAYLGVEPDATSCRVAAERLAKLGKGEIRQGVAPDVIETGRTFDLLCAFEVIEHIDDDRSALKTWADMVRPGGWVMLSAPAWAHRYGPWDGIVGHFRRYDPAALKALMRDVGLVDEQAALYGAGLGDVLERGRDIIGARRLRKAGQPIPHGAPISLTSETLAEQTAGSGRLLQPPDAAGLAMQFATAPFTALQRRFPEHGTGLVGLARKPA